MSSKADPKMASRLTRIPRAPIAACMTCPLCKDLFDGATTISTCLHTFCKRCIHEYFEKKEGDRCPVCETYLGSTPEDKLRKDRSLQDIRMKVFPMKKTGEGSKKTTRTGSPPGGGKQKPQVSSEDFGETDMKSNSGSKAKPPMSSPDDETFKEIVFDVEVPSENVNMWEPLSSLIDASKHANASFRGNGNEESGELVPPPKRKRGRPPKKTVITKTEDLPKPVQVNAEFVRDDQDKIPVWFALAPCEPKDYLPRLPARFLRIKKSEVTIEYIQKYIANKFEKTTENDVEIKLMGKTLLPDLLLSDVMRVWADDMAQASHFNGEAGDSSEEYLMPLKYLRK